MEKTTQKENIISYLKIGFFYTVVGILLLYIVFGIFMPDQTVKVFGFKPYVVITDSMEPVINVNALVFVKNPDVDELEVDDIITFRADINYDGEKEVVTHYIYSINEDVNGETIIRTHPYFENEADYIADNWGLREDDILGEYMFHVPGIGAVVQFVKSPFGIAAMIVNAGVIVGIVYIMKRTDKPEEDIQE